MRTLQMTSCRHNFTSSSLQKSSDYRCFLWRHYWKNCSVFMAYTNMVKNKDVSGKIIVKGGKKSPLIQWDWKATPNCILHRNEQQYANGGPYGWLEFQTGGCPLSAAVWMNPALWGETANQVLSPPSMPTPLSVQNPQRINLQGEWQGRQSFPLGHRERNRSSNQGGEQGGVATVCESKKERENAALCDTWGVWKG